MTSDVAKHSMDPLLKAAYCLVRNWFITEIRLVKIIWIVLHHFSKLSFWHCRVNLQMYVPEETKKKWIFHQERSFKSNCWISLWSNLSSAYTTYHCRFWGEATSQRVSSYICLEHESGCFEHAETRCHTKMQLPFLCDFKHKVWIIHCSSN